MFDFSSGELLLIALAVLIFIKPKDLPMVLRTVGQWTGKIRRMAGEFQDQFREAMREAEMADIKKDIDEATGKLGSGITIRSRSCTRRPSGSRPRRPRRRRPPPTRRRRRPPRRSRPSRRRSRRPRPRQRPRLRRRLSRPRPRASLPRRRRRRAETGPHDPRGHRGHQGAADRAPDRAALAPDQVGGRVLHRAGRLLLLRQARSTTC